MATVSTTISAPAPYYDDYTTSGIEDKNYMRILFKPGVSVQARELNQLQTGIQNQIAKFGSHIFPDNSRVLDGQISVQKNVDSIDMDMASGYQTTTSVTNNIVGQTIQISGGAVTAKVIVNFYLVLHSNYFYNIIKHLIHHLYLLLQLLQNQYIVKYLLLERLYF